MKSFVPDTPGASRPGQSQDEEMAADIHALAHDDFMSGKDVADVADWYLDNNQSVCLYGRREHPITHKELVSELRHRVKKSYLLHRTTAQFLLALAVNDAATSSMLKLPPLSRNSSNLAEWTAFTQDVKSRMSSAELAALDSALQAARTDHFHLPQWTEKAIRVVDEQVLADGPGVNVTRLNEWAKGNILSDLSEQERERFFMAVRRHHEESLAHTRLKDASVSKTVGAWYLSNLEDENVQCITRIRPATLPGYDLFYDAVLTTCAPRAATWDEWWEDVKASTRAACSRVANQTGTRRSGGW